MKQTAIQFILGILSFAMFLVSCSEDLVDSGKNPTPSNAKPIANVVFQNLQVGVKFEQEKKVQPNRPSIASSDPIGLKPIRTTPITPAMLDYKEGLKQDVQLLLALELPKTKEGVAPRHGVIYAYFQGSLYKDAQGQFHIAIQDEKTNPLYDRANATGLDEKSWVAVGFDPSLVDAYLAHPQDCKIYIAAIAGGDYFATHGKYGTINWYNIYQTTMGKPLGNANFYTGSTRGNDEKDADYNATDYTAYLQPGLEQKLNVPLTTEAWIPVPQEHNINVLALHNDKWEINLSSVKIKVKPYGQLLGLVYTGTSPVAINEIAFDFENAPKRTDANTAFDHRGALTMPLDVNVAFNTNDFTAKDAVLTANSFQFNNKSFKFKVNNWWATKFTSGGKEFYTDKPLYVWTHGSSADISFTVSTTPLKPIPGTFSYEGKAEDIRHIYKKVNGQEVKCATYFAGQQTTTKMVKELQDLENGKSYVVYMGRDAVSAGEVTDDGLIITEMLHNNPSGLYGDNYSMLELYNSTNKKIDLTKFALATMDGINNFQGKGGFNHDYSLKDAKVQILYDKRTNWDAEGVWKSECTEKLFFFHTPVRTASDETLYPQSNYRNRGRLMMGKYTRYLEPKKTMVLLAGHWVVENDSLSGRVKNPGEGMPPQVEASIRSAIKSGACQFVLALDNGEWVNGQGNTGAGVATGSGTLQHAGTKGFVLLKRRDAQAKDGLWWEFYDVLGLTVKDLGYLGDYQRDYTGYMAWFGWGFRQYLRWYEHPCGWARRRNNYFGDYADYNHYFFTQFVRKPKPGLSGDNADYGPFEETDDPKRENELWFTYEFKKGQQLATPNKQSWGYRSYADVPDAVKNYKSK